MGPKNSSSVRRKSKCFFPCTLTQFAVLPEFLTPEVWVLFPHPLILYSQEIDSLPFTYHTADLELVPEPQVNSSGPELPHFRRQSQVWGSCTPSCPVINGVLSSPLRGLDTFLSWFTEFRKTHLLDYCKARDRGFRVKEQRALSAGASVPVELARTTSLHTAVLPTWKLFAPHTSGFCGGFSTQA